MAITLTALLGGCVLLAAADPKAAYTQWYRGAAAPCTNGMTSPWWSIGRTGQSSLSCSARRFVGGRRLCPGRARQVVAFSNGPPSLWPRPRGREVGRPAAELSGVHEAAPGTAGGGRYLPRAGHRLPQGLPHGLVSGSCAGATRATRSPQRQVGDGLDLLPRPDAWRRRPAGPQAPGPPERCPAGPSLRWRAPRARPSEAYVPAVPSSVAGSRTSQIMQIQSSGPLDTPSCAAWPWTPAVGAAPARPPGRGVSAERRARTYRRAAHARSTRCVELRGERLRCVP